MINESFDLSRWVVFMWVLLIPMWVLCDSQVDLHPVDLDRFPANRVVQCAVFLATLIEQLATQRATDRLDDEWKWV